MSGDAATVSDAFRILLTPLLTLPFEPLAFADMI